jgi:ketosteroid isomerase-like protein
MPLQRKTQRQWPPWIRNIKPQLNPTMLLLDQILADDFVLVTGRGKVSSKADLIESARKKEVAYERQDEEPGTQKVRVWGDTAVVTALLWIKAEQGGKPVDYKLWFSDTYVRTPTGWRYVFGQASVPLPKTESK